MTTTAQKKIERILSCREVEILKLIALGTSRSNIAEQLDISVFTYDEHRKNIKNKLGLKSHADWAKVLIPFLE